MPEMVSCAMIYGMSDQDQNQPQQAQDAAQFTTPTVESDVASHVEPVAKHEQILGKNLEGTGATVTKDAALDAPSQDRPVKPPAMQRNSGLFGRWQFEKYEEEKQQYKKGHAPTNNLLAEKEE